MTFDPRWFEGWYPPEIFVGRAILLSTGAGGSGHMPRVRDALTYLSRFAFPRGYQLIVRADLPVLLPLLDESVRFARPGGDPSLVVFEDLSAQIPPDLLELGDWSRSERFLARNREEVRDAMVGCRNLVAAVFIGGDDTCDDYYDAWTRVRGGGLATFPIGSTGGAASRVLSRVQSIAPDLREVLDDVLSYPLVMLRIFEELSGTSGGTLAAG
jgi:hypothetical protein